MLVWLIALCCLTGETRGQMIRKYIENNYFSHYTNTLALAGSMSIAVLMETNFRCCSGHRDKRINLKVGGFPCLQIHGKPPCI